MAELPPHIRPESKQDCLDTWRSRGRIPVPTKSGTILDMTITLWVDAVAVNGHPADLLLEARASKRAPVRKFAVVFSQRRPEADYGVPVLWVSEADWGAQWVL